jgi:hypothetical protein
MNDTLLSRPHGLHPSFVLAAFSVKISALCRRRCALKHRHSSRLARSPPGVLAPVRVILFRSINT